MHDIEYVIKPSLAFYDGMPDGILITDLDGHCIYANEIAGQLLASTKKKLLGKSCINHFYQPKIFADFIADLGIKKRILRNVECITTNDEIIKVQVCATPVYSETNEPIGVQLIFLSNSENSGKNQIKDDASILKALNFYTDEIVIVSDIKRKANLFCSQNVEKIMGWRPKDFINGGWAFVMSLNHPDDFRSMSETYAKEFQEKNKSKGEFDHLPVVFEYRKRHYDGSWRWIRSQVFVLERNERKEIQLTVSFLRDITIEKIAGPVLTRELTGQDLPAGLKTLWSGDSRAINEIILSAREKQILQFVKEGLSTKKIAHMLGLSEASINTYRKKLMQKLNAKNTAELVKRSYELKIFE